MRIALAAMLILTSATAQAAMTADQRTHMQGLFEAQGQITRLMAKYGPIKASVALGAGDEKCIVPGGRHCDETIGQARQMVQSVEMRIRDLAATDFPGAGVTIVGMHATVAEVVNALDLNRDEVRAILDAYAALP